MEKGNEKENGENTKKEQENLGNAQLLKIVADLQQQMAEMRDSNKASSFPVQEGMTADGIAKIVEAAIKAGQKDKDIDYEAGIYEDEIPEDDYNEVGVRFCAPFVGYVVVDDKRKGRRVKLPYGKPNIFFEYSATRRVQQGRYEAIAPFSIYTSNSNKEIEWIRNHSHFNIFFYESATSAVNVDIMKMQKLSKIMLGLVAYDFIDLLKRCKEYNVATGEDAAIMRANLAYAMVNAEMDSEQQAAKRLLDDTQKEMMLASGSRK